MTMFWTHIQIGQRNFQGWLDPAESKVLVSYRGSIVISREVSRQSSDEEVISEIDKALQDANKSVFLM